MVIRPLVASDWPDVARIYGAGIATGEATFETAVPSWEEWDSAHVAEVRLVAEDGGAVVGWAALSRVSSRQVYSGVAEVSVYVDGSHHGEGVGSALLGELIAASEEADYWTLQTTVFPENEASIALHERHGFRTVGTRERIGAHRGRWRDTVLMERRSALVGV